MKILIVPALLAALTACGGGEVPEEPAQDTSLPATFWTQEDPTDVLDVFAVREQAQNGDSVVVKGTVKDFVDGLAVFTLVEDTLKSCDEISGDRCATPWDYCCADPVELVRGTATVEFHEGDAPGPWTVRGARGIDHLSEVVVAGTLHVDDANNLTIVADSIRLQ